VKILKNIKKIWHKEAEIITEELKKHNATVRKYYEANKEEIYQIIKGKREESKIKFVVSKLESIDVNVLAKILTEARKTKLLEIQE
jgi:hypothetical protein